MFSLKKTLLQTCCVRQSKQFRLTRRFVTSKTTQSRVVITGLGCVSPLGANVQTSWSQLLTGKSVITKLETDQFQNLPSRVAGVIHPNVKKLMENFKHSDSKLMTNATKYALLATEEAMNDSNLRDFDKSRTGVSIGCSMMDIQELGETFVKLQDNYKSLGPFFCPKIILNMTAGLVAMKYELTGPNQTVTTACASATHAIGNAFNSIRYGESDVMICGGTEASINPFTLAIFCRLRALTTKYNDQPTIASRPFDRDRDGFVMAEGAGILVLESLTHALGRNAKIYGEILGYGQSCDAFHVTAPANDSRGAIQAMRLALGNVDADAVGYVNAHGSSTPLGDALEVKAIAAVFKRRVSVSSTKGAHGHLLGAAGALEFIMTVKAVEEGVMPGNVNLECVEFDEVDLVRGVGTFKRQERRVALKNSFGFGGTNACLCVGEFCL